MAADLAVHCDVVDAQLPRFDVVDRFAARIRQQGHKMIFSGGNNVANAVTRQGVTHVDRSRLVLVRAASAPMRIMKNTTTAAVMSSPHRHRSRG